MRLQLNFKGTYNFDQQISIVWKTLNNPDAIKACIDGCSQFIEVESNVYKAKIKINLGPVNANFSSEIKKRNKFDPINKKQKDIPYLVDQHLLDKNV